MKLPPWLSHNPVAWGSAINALIDVAIAFGAPITDAEKAGIMLFIGAITALLVQSQVTSTAKLATLGVTIGPPTVVTSPPAVTAPELVPPTGGDPTSGT